MMGCAFIGSGGWPISASCSRGGFNWFFSGSEAITFHLGQLPSISVERARRDGEALLNRGGERDKRVWKGLFERELSLDAFAVRVLDEPDLVNQSLGDLTERRISQPLPLLTRGQAKAQIEELRAEFRSQVDADSPHRRGEDRLNRPSTRPKVPMAYVKIGKIDPGDGFPESGMDHSTFEIVEWNASATEALHTQLA